MKECPECGYPRGSSNSLELLAWAYEAGRLAAQREAEGKPLPKSSGWPGHASTLPQHRSAKA